MNEKSSQISTRRPLLRAAAAAALAAAPATALVLLPPAASAQDPAVVFKGSYGEPAEPPASARAEEPRGPSYNINAVVVTGDREEVYALPNWESYENDALYDAMSEADIESFRQSVLKDLQEEGFIFASVQVYRPSLQLGFLKLRVHVGEEGEVTVISKGQGWFTAEQVLDAVNWKTGTGFNYRSLYDDLFALNVHPSMKVKTNLRPRVDADGKRIVDVDLEVDDRWPVHVAWNLANNGTKETGSWRSRMTAQVMNVSKNDDDFTIDWLTDPQNLQEINSVTMAYTRPLGPEWKAHLHGGVSESAIDGVIPQLETIGEGWFIGLNLNKRFIDNRKYSLDMSFGWLFQESQNVNRFAGTVLGDGDRTVKLSMPRWTLGYATKDYDGWGGRNFFSHTLMASVGGQFGSSTNLNSSTQNPGADNTFLLDRIRFARYQQLFMGNGKVSNWSLYMRLDAQLTTNAVPSTLYTVLGGQDTVRGYRPGEVFGDYGWSGTLELRTPILQNFFPGLVMDEQYLKDNPTAPEIHRLQAVAFYDAGMVFLHDPIAGQQDDTFIQGAGVGFRLGLTPYAQFRVDHGFPIQETDDSHSRGRTHISLQLQY